MSSSDDPDSIAQAGADKLADAKRKKLKRAADILEATKEGQRELFGLYPNSKGALTLGMCAANKALFDGEAAAFDAGDKVPGRKRGLFVVSAIGNTTAGKSFVLQHLSTEDNLIVPYSRADVKAELGGADQSAAGSAAEHAGQAAAVASLESTSVNAHAFLANRLFPAEASNAVGMMIDFEGSKGTKKPFMAMSHSAGLARDGAERRAAVEKYFPCLAYSLSNVVLFVGKDDIISAKYTQEILDTARKANGNVQSVLYRPVLVIVQNMCMDPQSAADFDVHATTGAFAQTDIAVWNELCLYFSDVRCIRLPKKDENKNDQQGKLLWRGDDVFESQMAELRNIFARAHEQVASREFLMTYEQWLSLSGKVVAEVRDNKPVHVYSLMQQLLLDDKEEYFPFRVALGLMDVLPMSGGDPAVRFRMVVQFCVGLLAVQHAFPDGARAASAASAGVVHISSYGQLKMLWLKLQEIAPCMAEYPVQAGQLRSEADGRVFCGIGQANHCTASGASSGHRTHVPVFSQSAFLRWFQRLFKAPYNAVWSGQFVPMSEVQAPRVPSQEEFDGLIAATQQCGDRETAVANLVSAAQEQNGAFTRELLKAAIPNGHCLVCNNVVVAKKSLFGSLQIWLLCPLHRHSICSLPDSGDDLLVRLANGVETDRACHARTDTQVHTGALFKTGAGPMQHGVKLIADAALSAESCARFFEEMAPIQSHERLRSISRVYAAGSTCLVASPWLHDSLAAALEGGAAHLHGQQRTRIVRDVCEGLDFLASKQLPHGNLKLTNVLLDSYGRAVLGDYALHRLLNEPQLKALQDRLIDSGWGCPTGVLSSHSDLYSLGMLILVLVNGLRAAVRDVRKLAVSALGDNERLHEFVDPRARPWVGVEALVQLGVNLTHAVPRMRPSIVDTLRFVSALSDVPADAVVPPLDVPGSRMALPDVLHRRTFGGVRVLALHGGGIRGLVTIQMLRQLMEESGAKRVSDMFDLIVGTSTGGLLAIALGLLNFSLDECETMYCELAEEVFGRSWGRKVFGLATEGTRYDGTKLQRLIRARMGRAKMTQGPGDGPHVAVVAANCLTAHRRVFLFRSYDKPAPELDDGVTGHDCWHAALCTAAAPTYFDVQEVSGCRLVDGGLIANNPVEVALREAQGLFPRRPIDVVVSVGTGVVTEVVENSWIAGFLPSSVVESEQQDHMMQRQAAIHGFFFAAFNPTLSDNLGQLDMYTDDDLNALVSVTQRYITKQAALFQEAGIVLAAKAVVAVPCGVDGVDGAQLFRLYSRLFTPVHGVFAHVQPNPLAAELLPAGNVVVRRLADVADGALAEIRVSGCAEERKNVVLTCVPRIDSTSYRISACSGHRLEALLKFCVRCWRPLDVAL